MSEHIKQYKNFKTKGVITYKKLQVFSYIDEKDKIHAYLIKNNLVMEVISDKYSFNFNVMKSFIDYKEENVKFEKLELKDNHLTGYINYKNLKLKLNLESDYHEKEVVGLDNVIRLEKDNKRIVIKILDKINEENYEKYKEFYLKKIDKYIILIKKVKNYYYLVYFYNIDFDIDYLKKYFDYIVV